jgi:hypothetical protein
MVGFDIVTFRTFSTKNNYFDKRLKNVFKQLIVYHIDTLKSNN